MAKKQLANKFTSSHNTESTENPNTEVTWVSTNLLDDSVSGMKPKVLEEAKMLMGNNLSLYFPNPFKELIGTTLDGYVFNITLLNLDSFFLTLN